MSRQGRDATRGYTNSRQGRPLSLRDVARITGVDHKTVSSYLETAGIQRWPQRRHEHLRESPVDAHWRAHFVTEAHRPSNRAPLLMFGGKSLQKEGSHQAALLAL